MCKELQIMETKREATVDDLRRVRGKAELVNGELVLMSPAGGLHGYAVGRIFRSLDQYACDVRSGYALPDNIGFIVDLPNRRSFSPDVAYHRGRLGPDFVEGAPVFAVEVRSKEDYGPAAERAMAAKRADYFAAGTLVVWDVEVLREGWIRVFRASAPEQPATYGRGATAEAEPALTGWQFSVDELFPPEDTT